MLTALVLSFATAALASNATGPYGLHIKGKTDTSIDGYGGACHAGAAIEGICYGAGSLNTTATYSQFYFNYSGYNSETGEVSPYGWVEWQLPYVDQNGETAFEPEALSFSANLFSNVAAGLFQPGYEGGTIFQYNENGLLYITGGYDDRHNNETYPNPPTYFGNTSSFHLCYQFTGGYYYQSIAWVSGTAPPQNPSCEPVDLSLQLI
ncbi:hypothetical protein JX265_011536 [Neoarthrinium moseri]|uniref:Uncharacterized protein n=1 Tax=Neoarthrinium moseri TaxID=1658444 RepID=A0A9P9WBV5_9PEZI|nr:uncharacterized protein JN550_011714 [Neoarthrinium moseri]KAI1848610.1 hypothetical protein JX266_005469 [Neoarthrinium moseri]KAI1856577.1 hypothetical protein JX265_011536 [Neoarthrinium moseri]KAI1860030.1 hypothetical protein JN550_011714 [Neoarthrinium moseri]